jgi:hypothetical protein
MRIALVVALGFLTACAGQKLALAPPVGVDFSGSWKLNEADSDDPLRLTMSQLDTPATSAPGAAGGQGGQGGGGGVEDAAVAARVAGGRVWRARGGLAAPPCPAWARCETVYSGRARISK